LSKKNERAKNETSQAIPDDHEPVVVVQSALQGSHAIEPIASNQNQDPVSGDLQPLIKQDKQNMIQQLKMLDRRNMLALISQRN